MMISGHKTRTCSTATTSSSEQRPDGFAVRKLQKFQDAAEPACQPAQAESSNTGRSSSSSSTDNASRSEIGNDNPCSRHLSESRSPLTASGFSRVSDAVDPVTFGKNALGSAKGRLPDLNALEH